MTSLPAEAVTLSPDDRLAMRRKMEYDPWLFSLLVCKRDAKAERHHRPLLYIYTRRAALLVACLKDPNYAGPVTWQVRAHLERLGIKWELPESLPLVKHALRRVNVRMPRSSGKSTFADDGDLWDVTVDPNLTISIGSKADDFAFVRIGAIGEFVKTPEYAYWFPDRVPDDLRTQVTNAAIWIKGRSRIVPEASIEGRGINSQWTGRHYRKNRRDDIVGTESGEASISDATRHMANIDALHDETGWVQDVYVGTINGEDDDHAILADDPGVMSIVVPIETHEGGTTLENIYDDGELQMPEWFDRERVSDIKNGARKNKEHGPIYLLQNYFMAAHKSGTSIFTSRMIEQATYEWIEDEKTGRSFIRRPKKGMEKTPRSKLRKEDWFTLDLKSLPRTAFATGIDQSVAENGSADKWAMVVICVDHEGVYYVLDSLAEHGYDQLLTEINPFDRKHGKPGYVAIDANATQSMTVEWLKRSEEFRDLARRVVEVRSNSERKDVNIRNWLQARMLSGDLYVGPETKGPQMHRYRVVMLKYRPFHADGRRRRNPIDDELDATWMAMSVVRVPVSMEVSDEDVIAQEVNRIREQQSVNDWGMPTDNWMDALDGWGRVA